MNKSYTLLRDIMIAAAILAAVLSVAASVARARGAAGIIVSVLHYSGYGFMFISIILFVVIGTSG
jgi:hypothetical protein